MNVSHETRNKNNRPNEGVCGKSFSIPRINVFSGFQAYTIIILHTYYFRCTLLCFSWFCAVLFLQYAMLCILVLETVCIHLYNIHYTIFIYTNTPSPHIEPSQCSMSRKYSKRNGADNEKRFAALKILQNTPALKIKLGSSDIFLWLLLNALLGWWKIQKP